MTPDVDKLPPTQYLILEVLAARYRTGETTWTFPSHLRPHLLALADAGLIGEKSGVAPRSYIAWLTEQGRTAALSDTYEPPNGVASRARCDPREFGLTADDLRYLADAFYPDDDERRRRLASTYPIAVRAGAIRSRLRGIADAIDRGGDLTND